MALPGAASACRRRTVPPTTVGEARATRGQAARRSGAAARSSSSSKERDDRRPGNQKPRQQQDAEREQDRRASKVLRALGKPVRVEADTIDRGLDAGIQELDDQYEQHGADKQHPASAPRAASRRSWSRMPEQPWSTTSIGPVTGNAATGVPLAIASSSTSPNVSVLLGKTN